MKILLALIWLSNGILISNVYGQSDDLEFPPSSWLGFGIDMSTILPTDITSVTSNINTFKRLISLRSKSEKREIPGGATWTVPPNVNLRTDVTTGDGIYKSFETGTKFAEALNLGASATDLNFEVVKGGGTLNFGISGEFQEDYQYGIYNYYASELQAALSDYGDDIEKDFLKEEVNVNIPDKFDPNSDISKKAYRRFFELFGTHIVTEASYGSRLSLNVWASNTEKEVNAYFNLDVQATFNLEIVKGGASLSENDTFQYEQFTSSMQKRISVEGGDEGLAAKIRSNPTADDLNVTYANWVASAEKNPKVTDFKIVSLWDLMAGTADHDLVRRANDVSDAFDYLIKNKLLFKTECRLVITSDWGDLNLLMPSAYITFDPATVPNGTYSSTTKIGWQTLDPDKMGRDVTIDFAIFNDGTPIDFDTNHGAWGASKFTDGSIVAYVNKQAYVNDKDSGPFNYLNTKPFTKVPVNNVGPIENKNKPGNLIPPDPAVILPVNGTSATGRKPAVPSPGVWSEESPPQDAREALGGIIDGAANVNELYSR